MEKQKVKVMVVKDDEGKLRPLAGLWIAESPYSQDSIEEYLVKHKKETFSIVEAFIIEN